MRRLYTVELTSGHYSNGTRPAAIDGTFTDVTLAIEAVSAAATRYFGGGVGTITEDTGVKLDFSNDMRHPVWIVSRQVVVKWVFEADTPRTETVTVDGKEYSRQTTLRERQESRQTRMFAARIRANGYLVESVAEAAEMDDAAEERLDVEDDAVWERMKAEVGR